ncbi:MAG: TIGR02281 family clan AA aspartic protease [Gammaproteobacteria bacterium]|jgi:aspartyl protease family protein
MTLSRFLHVLPVIVLACLVSVPSAATDVRVVGLFNDRALVEVDGRQHLLRPGETSPEGVGLVSASSDGAVLEVDGRRISAALDNRVSARKRRSPDRAVQIRRNSSGMYTTVGSINGLPVTFLVDTGATQIAMNAAQARRLGIDYRVVGSPAAVTTASGTERAWRVSLNTVKVGELRLHDVSGVVIEGPQPAETLLGMSFLGRLEITNNGQLMTLRQKY